jgi:glutamate carboxypeptidase
MAQRLVALGCTITRYPGGGELGDCVAGTLSGRGKARILILGHLDTVYPDGTAVARPLRIEGNRAIGPGACDMKGGLLVGLYALQKLLALGFDDFAEITFFCSNDEEINSPCSQSYYLPLAAQADAALVLEAGWPKGELPGGALTSARKGGGRAHLYVTGREAHSGTEFERGASATLALARKIEALHALNGCWPGVTVNVGVIRGGSAYNTVAGHAYADIDLRLDRQQDIASLEEACRAIAARTDVPHTSARLQGGIVAPPMERTPAIAFLVELAQAEAASLGFRLTEHTSGGTSDASYVAAQGTPVLDGLGPIGAQDHSPDEYLLVDSILPRISLAGRLIIAITRHRAELAAIRQKNQ